MPFSLNIFFYCKIYFAHTNLFLTLQKLTVFLWKVIDVDVFNAFSNTRSQKIILNRYVIVRISVDGNWFYNCKMFGQQRSNGYYESIHLGLPLSHICRHSYQQILCKLWCLIKHMRSCYIKTTKYTRFNVIEICHSLRYSVFSLQPITTTIIFEIM